MCQEEKPEMHLITFVNGIELKKITKSDTKGRWKFVSHALWGFLNQCISYCYSYPSCSFLVLLSVPDGNKKWNMDGLLGNLLTEAITSFKLMLWDWSLMMTVHEEFLICEVGPNFFEEKEKGKCSVATLWCSWTYVPNPEIYTFHQS